MEKQKQNRKQILSVVMGVFALIIIVGGITYAFFNYTKTGSANTIRTGRIAFNSESSQAVTLSELFPITLEENETITPQTPGVGSLSIHITGDTSYSEGIEYLVKAVNVTGTTGVSLPISIAISYQANTEKTIGTNDEEYFTNRGGATSRYKVLSTDTIAEGTELVVGYIAPDSNGTGIDGTMTIMAYLDAADIAITDTYPSGLVRSVKTTNYSSSDCETALTGVTNASTYCATATSLQTAIDNSDLTNAQITLLVNAGIVSEYTNGTDSNWVKSRTVLTTDEWNSLQANGVSFQIKVEANEGIWVTGPVPTIDSCPGCKYMYTTSTYYYGGASNVNATAIEDIPAGVIKRNYNDVISASGENYFLGFTETQDGKIDRAYACGIKGEAPNEGTAFCIEGSLDDGHGGDSTTRAAVYSANSVILNDSTTGIWEGNCTSSTDIFGTGYVMRCGGTIKVQTDTNGEASVFSGSSVGDGNCTILGYGGFGCGKIS